MNSNPKKKNFFSLFKSKKVIATSLVIISFIIELISSIIYHHFFTNCNYMEILYYTTQIISSIFVVGGVVIAVWQYYLSCQDAKTNLEVIQVQRAIELSEYYKDNILRYLPAIYYIFDCSGASKILKTVRPEQMLHFHKQELHQVLSKEQITDLQKLTTTEQFLQCVIEANDIFNLNLKFRTKREFTQNTDKKEVTVYVNVDSILNNFLSQLINLTLNNMEYFALHFRHNVADESVVYQSLHKTYIDAVQYLYYYICNHNEDSSDKLYTNVTWLYHQWYDAQQQQNIAISEKSNMLQRHGTIVGNRNQ